MTQSIFVLPSEDWRRKIRRRLELLEGHRLGSREEVLNAFLRNLVSFQPDARKRIEMGLRIFDEAPPGACLKPSPGRIRYPRRPRPIRPEASRPGRGPVGRNPDVQ